MGNRLDCIMTAVFKWSNNSYSHLETVVTQDVADRIGQGWSDEEAVALARSSVAMQMSAGVRGYRHARFLRCHQCGTYNKQVNAEPRSWYGATDADETIDATKRRQLLEAAAAVAGGFEWRPGQGPGIRFDSNATRKPGQILKLHVTLEEMMEPGDKPNWGWVDPPEDFSEEEVADWNRQASQAFAEAIGRADELDLDVEGEPVRDDSMGMSVSGGYVPCAYCGGFIGEVTYGFINIRDSDRWEAGRDERSARAWRIQNNPCTCRHDLQPGQDLKLANLKGANLSGVNLSEADLSGANLVGAKLEGADLSLADLSQADLSGVWLMNSNLEGATNLKWAKLHGANLAGANLYQADLSGASLLVANLVGANLSRTNLYQADLTGADLTEAKADEDTTWPEGFDPKAAGVIFE